MLTRRKFLYAGSVAVAGAAALGADGLFESYDLQLKKLEIRLARLPAALDGFTIVQLSDFHYERHFSAVTIRKSIELVNNLSPDLIVLTGDFVTVGFLEFRRHARRYAWRAAFPCAQMLAQLKARLGKFAVLGNHDVYSDGAEVSNALQSHGIQVLTNACVPIERGHARFWLAGIDDALEGEPDLGLAIKKVPPGEPIVLLAHEPDFADEASLMPVDLQLSGHSHGGQIWIPGIGAPWLPPLARIYPRGLYRIDNLTLYTNVGIGTIRAPVRLNCVPEVTLITLRAGAS